MELLQHLALQPRRHRCRRAPREPRGLGRDLGEGDRLKQASNLAAVSELVGRDDTVRKQLAANNSEEQMMQGGDLQRAVTRAVIEMLAESSDGEKGESLLRDEERMASYARLVFKLLAGALSREDLLRSV